MAETSNGKQKHLLHVAGLRMMSTGPVSLFCSLRGLSSGSGACCWTNTLSLTYSPYLQSDKTVSAQGLPELPSTCLQGTKTRAGQDQGAKKAFFKQGVKPQVTFLLSAELGFFLTSVDCVARVCVLRWIFRQTKARKGFASHQAGIIAR